MCATICLCVRASLGVWSGYSLPVHDYEMCEGPWNVDHFAFTELCSSQGHASKLTTHAILNSRYQNKVSSFSTCLPSSQASEILLHLIHIILQVNIDCDLSVIYNLYKYSFLSLSLLILKITYFILTLLRN